jgi:hypothetical protein
MSLDVAGKLEPVLEPVLNTLADRQSRHLNWERRRDLIYLRVLHKLLGQICAEGGHGEI